jgi:large subunit ribosomal protein L13
MKVIDATDLILGRMCTRVAKMALNGEDVQVINCEKAVIIGKKSEIFNRFIRFTEMGVPAKGPFIHRGSDRIVRRTVRGMLPYKLPRGAEAFKRIMCYIGNPDNVEGAESIEDADIKKTNNIKFVTIKQVSEKLGFKY